VARGERGGEATGAGRVARALGLKYETLKQRVISGSPSGARGGAGREKALGRAEFIELRRVSRAGPVRWPRRDGGGDVGADGTRLTIRLKGASPDWMALIQRLRGRP